LGFFFYFLNIPCALDDPVVCGRSRGVVTWREKKKKKKVSRTATPPHHLFIAVCASRKNILHPTS
jgi:hypothetical protein